VVAGLSSLAIALTVDCALHAASVCAASTSVSRRAQPKSAVRSAASDSVVMMNLIRQLADPLCEGRGIGTLGIERAAQIIRDDFSLIKLGPAIDDTSFDQFFEVTTGVAIGDPCAVEVGGRRFPVGEDMQPIGFSTNGTLRAPVVFAGYGITAPGFEYDDYAGLDAHDKIVLVLSNEPDEMDSTSRFDGSVNTPHAELRTKAINAREHGALGILVVDGPRYHAGEPLRAPSLSGAGYMTSGLLAARISASAAEALLRPSGLDLATAQRIIDEHEKPHSFALAESARVTVTLKRTRAKIHDVVAWMRGRDTTRTLVIGAHYDHLGFGGESSLAPDSHLPHLGADDNASGVAAMFGAARMLGKRYQAGWRPQHNLVFCAFTGEESGLLGSAHFVDDPSRPLESIEAMINMDMVGRLRNNKLLVAGVGTADEFPALIQNANRVARFDLKTSQDGYGPSDHSSFYKRQIPVLFLFTGAHADYHKPSDTWDKINGQGVWRVARFVEALVESLDARPRVHYRKAESDSSIGRIAGGGGYGSYLGTIPDYMQTEGGVLLSGVRAGGPADQAGLKGEDVIVKFDGVRIDNIYDYTYALRSRRPGQSVRITVKRAGKELELVATLGRRP
jgi:hypothetical protein